MEKGKLSRIKKLLVFIVALFFAVGLIGAEIYWTRNIQHNINIIGIAAELIEPTFEGYDQKLVTTQLHDGKIAVVIIAEDFYDIYLNVSWTCDAEGIAIDVRGQYYELYWFWNNAQGKHIPMFSPLDTPFIINNAEAWVVDKSKMMLVDITKPSAADSNHGYCLVVSLVWDAHLVTLPGNYTIDILFQGIA